MNKQIFTKKSTYLILLLILGIILIIFSGAFSKSQITETKSDNLAEFELCEKRCEEKLSILLKQINGIQDASVLVTLDEIPSNKNRPRVRGVAIVCQGEETSDLRLKVVMLVSSALGITSDKIYITFS